MERFWPEEQHSGGRFPIEAIRGEESFPDAASGLLCDTLALRGMGSWVFKLTLHDADGRPTLVVSCATISTRLK